MLRAGKLARRWCRVCPVRLVRNMPVMTVALDRLAASFADGVFKGGDRLLLRSGRTRHVENFFLQDSSMEIVDAVAQRDLRERQSEADPIRRQVVDIVEINTAHCEVTQLLKRGGALDVGENPVRLRWLECKRNKPREPAGLILQLPQLAQMISAMGKRFDVSVKHRACAAATHRMPGAMHVEPFSGRFLSAADLVAHDRIENLGATPGDRTKPCVTENLQRISNRHLKDSLGQMTRFDGSESLYMQVWIEPPQPSQEIEVPVFFQSRMQSADHVHLGHAEPKRIRHRLKDFVNCVFECVRVAFLGGKSTELAG